MSCQTPKVLATRYMDKLYPAVPPAGDERRPLMAISYANSFAAVEIDCSSEIDCCIIEDGSHTFHFVAVGAPALGPLPGPLAVLPWRRVLPYSNDGQGFAASPLLLSPPILAVKVHTHAPAHFQQRRGPVHRESANFATPASYDKVAEFPLYGMRRARLKIFCQSSGGGESALFDSLSFQIYGATYPGNIGGIDGEPNGYDGVPDETLLVLDSTGATARTVAFAGSDSITIDGEPFDTLILYAQDGSGPAAGRAVFVAEED